MKNKGRASQLISLQRRLGTVDREVTRISIALATEIVRSNDFETRASRNLVPHEFMLRILEDNARLTSKIGYRFSRIVKLGFKKIQFFRSDKNYLQDDVLPLSYDYERFLAEFISTSFMWEHYLERYPDIERSGINPYTHFFLHGEKEARRLSEKSS